MAKRFDERLRLSRKIILINSRGGGQYSDEIIRTIMEFALTLNWRPLGRGHSGKMNPISPSTTRMKSSPVNDRGHTESVHFEEGPRHHGGRSTPHSIYLRCQGGHEMRGAFQLGSIKSEKGKPGVGALTADGPSNIGRQPLGHLL